MTPGDVGAGPDRPALSVVMPARDDATHLPAAVAAVLAQEFGQPFEVVIAVGPSRDGTEQVADELTVQHAPRVRVVPNPSGGTAAGLNAAIRGSSGAVIARVDSHSELTPGYLARAYELLTETGADNVGGIQLAVGTTPFQRAVAAAMSSRFGTGDATFHYGGEPGPTDTVYLGVFRREALERVGGFDESLVRNQDYELNIRIRDAGGTVYFHPDLQVVYRPRNTLRGLVRQYFDYGRWKRHVIRRHPGSARWRQLVPPAAVLVLIASMLSGAVAHPAWFAPVGVYGIAVLAASALGARSHGIATGVRLLAIYPAMHLSWGLGFLAGPAGRRVNSTA